MKTSEFEVAFPSSLLKGKQENETNKVSGESLLGDNVPHEVDPPAGEVVELVYGGDGHQGVPQHARQLVPWRGL